MALIKSEIEQALRTAVGQVVAGEHSDLDLMVQPTNNPSHGDFQANFVMKLAKGLGKNPRELAADIVAAIAAPQLLDKVEVAGPGFINMTLNSAAIGDHISEIAADAQLGVQTAAPQTVVVDYSSPNVAKEMHVGHLRSTIIGDAIVRVIEFIGHKVIRQNHIGDWGTQFGMLIEYLNDLGYSPEADWEIESLDGFYQAAKKKFDADEEFSVRAKQRVVKLQGGDEATIAFWKKLCSESYKHFSLIYKRLNVQLTEQDVAGESVYNDDLAKVIETLEKQGLVVVSDGAKVIYPEGFKGKDDSPMGMIVQKSDGAFLYATTDLAAARHRINNLAADRIVYVTDSRQSLHFAMLFEVLRSSGWAGEGVRLQHVPFGTVLGKDHKPFKTREGGTVKLASVLDECVKHAEGTVRDKSPDLADEECQKIAHIVGIGALKYADLSSDRIKDYVFDMDRMLSLEGNTAPYMQYSYARICSILRRLEESGLDVSAIENSREQLLVGHEVERNLALKLLQFPTVIDAVADSLEPHRLAGYLYEVASLFHSFYEHCPVMKADSDAVRDSRIRLLKLMQSVLRTGLGLLGIDVIEKM